MTFNFALNSVFDRVQLTFDQLRMQTTHFIDDKLNLSNARDTSTHKIQLASLISKMLATRKMPATVSAPSATAINNITNISNHSTGHAALDAALPTKGWPKTGAVEITADAFAFSELVLFLPLFQRLTAVKEQVALISPPQMPHFPSLRDYGVDTHHLQVVMASGHAGYWAASKALSASTARVLLYWPDLSISAAQRQKLVRGATASGTLLFLFVATTDLPLGGVTLRLAMSDGTTNKLNLPENQPFTTADDITSANDLLAATPAIIFEQPQSRAGARKKNKPSSFPTLNGIGYTSSPSRPQQSDVSSIADAAERSTSTASRRIDAWVTVIPTETIASRFVSDNNAVQSTVNSPIAQMTPLNMIALYANLDGDACATPAATVTLIDLKGVLPSYRVQKTAQNAVQQAYIESTLPPIIQCGAGGAGSANDADSAGDAPACPSIDPVVAITPNHQSATQAFELAKNRLDALRLPRDRSSAICIDMPVGINTTFKLSTPSSRARQLALINLKNSGQNRSASTPVIGQILLRKQANSLGRVNHNKTLQMFR